MKDRRVPDSSPRVVATRDRQPPEGWDQFVASAPQGHPEQASAWAVAESLDGWEAAWVVVRDEEGLAAGAQILHRPVGCLGRIAYVRHGPVFRDASRALRVEVVEVLGRWASDNRVRYLVINPSGGDEACETQLRHAGLVSKPLWLAPRILTTATLLIDLRRPLATILAEMRREKRRKIRDAGTSGLAFREGGRSDLAIFYDLLKITAAKQGSHPNPSSFAYLDTLWGALSPAGHMRLFLVELAGDPICAGIIFPFAGTVRFWRYGWNGTHAERFPVVWLHWSLIQWSAAQKCRCFDIVQVDSVLAGKIAGQAPLTAADRVHRLFGQTLFKTGFGGEIVQLPGPLCRFYPAWVNGLFRHVGMRILSRHAIPRIMQPREQAIIRKRGAHVTSIKE